MADVEIGTPLVQNEAPAPAQVNLLDPQDFDVKYESMLKDLRATFATLKTWDIDWRRKQLEQVIKMYQEQHAAMNEAVNKDMSGGDLRLIGEMMPHKQAWHCLDHLDEWTSPEWVSGWVHRGYIRHEPKGVVLIISPWNFPFNLTWTAMTLAIAAGNCVVLKPSELSPHCTALIKKLTEQYFDNDCIKVIEGGVPETTALLRQQWDHIYYTGNGAVARIVMQAAAKSLTPVTLELGGKNAVIIDETAKISACCARLMFGKWTNAGQICLAPDYILVHASKAKEFKEEFIKQIKAAFGDDVSEKETFGKIINDRHVQRIKRLLETCSGRVLVGGLDGIKEEDRYIPPTLIEDPLLTDPIMNEEIFGPLLPILTYTSLTDALDIKESIETPLAFYVFSENAARTDDILKRCQSGGACVNSCIEHFMTDLLPFGGKGPSGIGAAHWKYGFDELSHHRSTLYKSTLPGFSGAYAPPPVNGYYPPILGKIVMVMELGVLPLSFHTMRRKKPVKYTVQLMLLVLTFFVLLWSGLLSWSLRSAIGGLENLADRVDEL